MRPLLAVAAVAAQYQERLSPPPSTAATCDPHTCTWRPYGNSKDFEANAAMIVIILFCVLICALALNAAIRCSLRRSRLPETQRKPSPVAAAAQQVEPPTLVFSAGMKLVRAEAECAICLSEFVEGEGIRVLGRCNHGFHVHCIQQWLSSHSSCPTCRGTCLPSTPSSDRRPDNGVDDESPPAVPDIQRGPEQI